MGCDHSLDPDVRSRAREHPNSKLMEKASIRKPEQAESKSGYRLHGNSRLPFRFLSASIGVHRRPSGFGLPESVNLILR